VLDYHELETGCFCAGVWRGQFIQGSRFLLGRFACG
jgi:hypothetical protein